MGSRVRWRAGAWRLEVTGPPDPATGKPKWFTATVRAKSEKDRAGIRARDQRLAELTIQAATWRPSVTLGQRATMREAWSAWVGAASPGWSPGHRRDIASTGKNHVLPAFGDRMVDTIRRGELDLWLVDKRASLAASTVNKIRAALSGCFTACVRWGLVDVNPVRDTMPQTLPKLAINPPTPKALGALLNAVESDAHTYCWVMLCANTGMRLGSICRLMWRDVDLDRGQVVFHRTKTDTPVAVAVDAETVRAVERWRKRQTVDAFQLGARPSDTTHVLALPVRLHAEPNPGTYSHKWERLRAEHPGLEGHRLYDLRHFAATQMLAAGVPVPTVAHRLAHDPATLLRRYAAWIPAQDQAAAEGLAETIAEGRRQARRLTST
jgi:integrase